MESKEYIVTVYTENRIGVLNRITAIYLRRKLNIESLKVVPSNVDGISIFVISAYTSEEMMVKIVSHIKKIVDVIDAEFADASKLIRQEIALYRISKSIFEDRENMEYATRNVSGRIIELTSDYVVFKKTGNRDEIEEVRDELMRRGILEQFTRSGSVILQRIPTDVRLKDFL